MKFYKYFLLATLLFSCKSKNEDRSSITQFKVADLLLAVKIDSTFIGNKEYIIGEKTYVKEIYLAATLSNKTLELIRYYSMTCSWASLFCTDSHDLSVYPVPCYSNWWFIDCINPGEIKSYNVTIITKPSNQEKEFKLGFNCIKDHQIIFSDDSIIDSLHNMKHIIWSNAITQ